MMHQSAGDGEPSSELAMLEGGTMLDLTRMFPPKLITIAVLVCLTTLMGACVAAPSSQPDAAPQNAPRTPEFSTTQIPVDEMAAPEAAQPAAQSECPGLDSALAQVVASPDPLEQARQSLLTVKDGKIQVVLVLSQQDTGFLQDYDVEIGTQSGMQAQVFVSPDRLCDLAKTDEVLAINLPAQAVPQ
jgi:hypothetical protein